MKSLLVFIIASAFAAAELPFATTWKVGEELQGGKQAQIEFCFKTKVTDAESLGAKVFYGKDGKEDEVKVLNIVSKSAVASAARYKPKGRYSFDEFNEESLYKRSYGYGRRPYRHYRAAKPTQCFVAKIQVPVNKIDVDGSFTLKIGKEESAASSTVIIRAPVSKAAAEKKKSLWLETEPMCEDVKCLREQQAKCAKMLKEIVDDLATCQEKSCNSAELKQYADFMARQCQKVVEGVVNAVDAFIEGAPDVKVSRKEKKEQTRKRKKEEKNNKGKPAPKRTKQEVSQDDEEDRQQPQPVPQEQPEQPNEDDDVLTPQKDGDRFDVGAKGNGKKRTSSKKPEQKDDKAEEEDEEDEEDDVYW